MYNGIIGDLTALAAVGVIDENGFIEEQLERQYLITHGEDLKRLTGCVDRVKRAATIGNFWTTASQILTTILGAGGSAAPVSCPVCPPVRQKGITEMVLPIAAGFAVGYFFIPKKKRK